MVSHTESWRVMVNQLEPQPSQGKSCPGHHPGESVAYSRLWLRTSHKGS